MTLIAAAPFASTVEACEALQFPRATFYRWAKKQAQPTVPKQTRKPPLALTAGEEQRVLDLLHHDAFVDKAPQVVFFLALMQGLYLCSPRTMYRILTKHQESKERRNQLRHPVYAKPELLATEPNQVWSWDITKLRGPVKWTYYYLYVIINVFSRYVTGWMLADAENARYAKQLIGETFHKHGVQPNILTIHADRGAPMISKPLSALLTDLCVAKTHSRPHTSNDNPFSEAQFKTMKYHPSFPDRFASRDHAHAFCTSFFSWYNNDHLHEGIAYLAPADFHFGRVPHIIAQRQRTLDHAFVQNPARFKYKKPQAPQPPTEVWINKPTLILGKNCLTFIDRFRFARDLLIFEHRYANLAVYDLCKGRDGRSFPARSSQAGTSNCGRATCTAGGSMKKRNLFEELISGVDAMADERRGKITLRSLSPADQALQPLAIDATLIRQTREQLNLSRSVFAHGLRVAVRTLENWEQGRAKPNAQAAALILMVRKFPDTFGRLQHLRE